MKFFVISLLSVSLLFANAPEGTTEDIGIEFVDGVPLGASERSETPLIVFESWCDEPPNLGYEYSSPVERALFPKEEEGYSSPMPGTDWGPDVMIYPGEIGTGQDFDVCEDTGDMYAVIDTDHDGTTITDSLRIYLSQDNGFSWSYFGCGTSSYGTISNPKIRVFKDGSGDTWVMIMGIWETSGAGVIWTRRWPIAGGITVWEQAAGDASYADLDADVGSGAYAYIAYSENGTSSIRAIRNLIGGAGWQDDANIHALSGITDNLPAIATGANGTVNVGFIFDTASDVPSLRIKRSTDNALSWFGSNEVALFCSL